jgi:hypothetical protein
MNRSVELEHQPQLRAIEIHDESIDGVLSAELEAEHLTISQETPRGPLRCGDTAAERAGSFDETELDRIMTEHHRTTILTTASAHRAYSFDQHPFLAFPLSR